MMKLSKLFVIAVLAGTLGVIGCSDDPPSEGNGGTGGGSGTDISCDEGRCVDVDQATKCEDKTLACIDLEPANETACIAFGNFLFCSEGGTGGTGGSGGMGGEGGTGGTAGSGGMGGEGGTGGGIDVSCDEGRCVDPTVATECETAILACIAAEPANEEKCIALGNLFFCSEDVLVPVFVTSQRFRGALGGVAPGGGVDRGICTESARVADVGGNWTAWLSTNDSDARDRIPEGQYLRLDGTVVADDKAALTNAASVDLKAKINLDENGDAVTTNFEVWTGTNPDGTKSEVGNYCVNWTNNEAPNSASSGYADFTNGSWTDEPREDLCTEERRVYCFSAPISN
jgi:hypothetical protein